MREATEREPNWKSSSTGVSPMEAKHKTGIGRLKGKLGPLETATPKEISNIQGIKGKGKR